LQQAHRRLPGCRRRGRSRSAGTRALGLSDAKLDVQTRREAVERAPDLGLLSLVSPVGDQ
jgi:hypothetical protein